MGINVMNHSLTYAKTCSFPAVKGTSIMILAFITEEKFTKGVFRHKAGTMALQSRWNDAKTDSN